MTLRTTLSRIARTLPPLRRYLAEKRALAARVKLLERQAIPTAEMIEVGASVLYWSDITSLNQRDQALRTLARKMFTAMQRCEMDGINTHLVNHRTTQMIGGTKRPEEIFSDDSVIR